MSQQFISPFKLDPNRPIREQINLWTVGSMERGVVVMVHAVNAEQALVQGKALLSSDPLTGRKSPLPTGTPIGILPIVDFNEGLKMVAKIEAEVKKSSFQTPGLFIP